MKEGGGKVGSGQDLHHWQILSWAEQGKDQKKRNDIQVYLQGPLQDALGVAILPGKKDHAQPHQCKRQDVDLGKYGISPRLYRLGQQVIAGIDQMEGKHNSEQEQISGAAHLNLKKQKEDQEDRKDSYTHKPNGFSELKLRGKAVAVYLGAKIYGACNAGMIIAEIRYLDDDLMGLPHNVQRKYDILVVLFRLGTGL